jgi:hypothetical protein
MLERYSNYSHRKNRQSPLIITGLAIICLCSWFVGYLFSVGYPIPTKESDTPLWVALCSLLSGKEVVYIAGGLLTMVGAFLLHRANYTLALIKEKTYLPFFLYIFFISANPDFFPLNPASIGIVFIIASLYLLFLSYHDSEARKLAYNTALILSTGSLLWAHILCFFPLFWYGMYLFRTLTLRTFLASLLGLATVYWLLLGWSVWQDDFSFFTALSDKFADVQILTLSSVSILNWVEIIIVGVLNFVATINIIKNSHNENQRTRQYLQFLMILGVWSFSLFFLFEQSANEFLQIACISSAILVTHFFKLMQRRTLTTWTLYIIILIFISILFLRLWSFL